MSPRFRLVVALALVSLVVLIIWWKRTKPSVSETTVIATSPDAVTLWKAPDTLRIAQSPEASLIRYGRQLIANTSFYLGPQGRVRTISNGMNCQNCHLDAGTVPFGNNYGSVASLYPRFRARSGSSESIEKRVNDCLQRSLNGNSLDSLSREMRAIVAYLKWVGKDVPHGVKAEGSGLFPLPYLPRAADTIKGKIVFEKHCVTCHQKSGAGVLNESRSGYAYPPLWGANSFNTAAGLYRLSNLARYIYANMPVGSTHLAPTLTEEEAWDVAAYIVSKPRPHRVFAADWPDLKTKPIDHPFGPYADSFTELQHKYGPFSPIESVYKQKK